MTIDTPGVRLRSVADDIRTRSDEDLVTLLVARPDLARPAPADLTTLAARSVSRASTRRAIDGLDLAHLHVLEATAIAPAPLVTSDIAAVLGTTDEARVDGILTDLWRLALVWRSTSGLQPTRTVVDTLGPHPAGLGPAWADLVHNRTAPTDPDVIRDLVESAPPAARAVLDRLTAGPPVIVVPETVAGSTAVVAGITWLRGAGLLHPTDPDHLALPREIGLALRGGHIRADAQLEAPSLDGAVLSTSEVDAAAGAAASELLPLVDDLLSRWGPAPPRVLRGGGLSVRDLRSVARHLDVDRAQAAFVVELALAAELVADDGELEPVWAPTTRYDEWRSLPGADQWAILADAWRGSTRASHLVGTTSDTGVVNALGEGPEWPAIRSLRHSVIEVLAEAGTGVALPPTVVTNALVWHRPRRLPGDVDAVVTALLTEARQLGVVARGALSSAGRALLNGGNPSALAAAMRPHVPAPVDRIVLQADLTAIAPGPLAGSLAEFMRLIAVVESRGGATVHRFTPESVRRILDAGWSADKVLTRLAEVSMTPVPQPLDYLVHDVARRHGRLQIGTAGCYIRSDDEATLAALIVHRDLELLRLRQIAPTVLVSPVTPSMARGVLQDNGFVPVLESATGDIVISRPTPRRAQRAGRQPTLTSRVDAEVARALVPELRDGEADAARRRDDEARSGRPRLPSTDPTTSLAILREALAEGQAVWLGYANRTGEVRKLLFYPERVDGGRVTGTADGTRRTLSVHRITGAAIQ